MPRASTLFFVVSSALAGLGCRDAFEGRELRHERTTVLAVELTTATIDFDAVTAGQHFGACHVSGKSIGVLPYDQWTYSLEVRPKDDVQVLGLSPSELDMASGAPDGKNPFDDATLLEHCESAARDRMAFRLAKSSRDGFTVVLPFARSVLLLDRDGVGGKKCADVLAAQASPEDWLHASLTTRDADVLFAIQVANVEHLEREAVADAALGMTFEAEQLSTLVEELSGSEKLQDHVLARLAPEAAPGGSSALATAPNEAGIEALLAAIPEEKIEAAFVPDIAACKDVVKSPECTWLRLYAYAHWAAAMEKKPSCDALAKIAIDLAGADPKHLEAPISLKTSLGDCPEAKWVKELSERTKE